MAPLILHAQSKSDWRVVFDTVLPSSSYVYPSVFVPASNGVAYFGIDELQADTSTDWPPKHKKVNLWYKTHDGGKNWSKIDFGNLPVPERAIKFAPIKVLAPDAWTVYITEFYGQGGLYYSSDKGDSWKYFIRSNDVSVADRTQIDEFSVWQALSSNHIVFYNPALHRFCSSSDHGKSISQLLGDPIFEKYMIPFDSLINDTAETIKNGSHLVANTFLDWTLALRQQTKTKDLKWHPPGLTTFITHDEGRTWNDHNYRLPEKPEADIHVFLQAIQNTPFLYGFNTFHREGSWGELLQYGTGGYDAYQPDLSAGLTFLFSDDHGATWKPNYSFNTRFRAFEARDHNDIWLTVSHEDSINAGLAASWIVHSVDNGASWKIDSTTLWNGSLEFAEYFDGQILASHGEHLYLIARQDHRIRVLKYEPQLSVEASGGGIPMPAFSFYPLPSKLRTTLRIPNTLNIESLEAYDILGRKIFLEYKIRESSFADISTSNLPAGGYLVVVSYSSDYEPSGKYRVPLIVTQ